jgi:hypothetical protein
MNLRLAPNPSLKGHKLLILSSVPLSGEWQKKFKDEFPDLEIVVYDLPWGAKVAEKVPAEELKDVTILLTGSSLPDKELVPKLEYVQLSSAGANHILKHPLFTDTDVVFCTANGVHG